MRQYIVVEFRGMCAGLLLTVHGWDKRAVGTLTMELYRHIKANPYTGKGARIAFHPVKKKVSTKK